MFCSFVSSDLLHVKYNESPVCYVTQVLQCPLNHLPKAKNKHCGRTCICGESMARLLSISCTHGPEEEEAPGAAADPDWRDTLHHWVPEGSPGELAYKHRSPEEHGLRFQGLGERAQNHVRISPKWFTNTWESNVSLHDLTLHVCCCSLRDIDKIDDMMQDIADQQDLAREISDAISRPASDAFDEVFFNTFFRFSINIFPAKT